MVEIEQKKEEKNKELIRQKSRKIRERRNRKKREG